MPMLEAYMAAEAVGAMGGAAEAFGAAEALGALGATDLGAAGAMGAFDAGAGLGGGLFGSAMAPTTGAGITQAALGPATQGITAGGVGAGAPGINAEMVNMAQNAASSVPNAGTVVGQGSQADQIANFADIQGFGASEVPTPSNPFLVGMNSVMDWAKKNPYPAAGIAYTGAKKLGLFDDNAATAANRTPEKGIGYSMSPNFQGRFANPEDYQYTPKRYGYAEGGIMQTETPAYAKGGEAVSRGDRGDAGIYYDLDPDTRYQDALTAAQIRQAKVNKRANMQLPSAKRPTPMGQINLAPPGIKREASGSSLDPENAAHGGIMHSSLGGYAAGGNPRLLKGPGDGMSDDIPATINARQPARLADGEFVVPADVVSHLGNGSTDAGAKKLHEMMTKVRRERTGNPKQGKKINPNKFVPK